MLLTKMKFSYLQTKSSCLKQIFTSRINVHYHNFMSSLNIHHVNFSVDPLLSLAKFLPRYNIRNHKAFFILCLKIDKEKFMSLLNNKQFQILGGS
jgi:hypothetical protein